MITNMTKRTSTLNQGKSARQIIAICLALVMFLGSALAFDQAIAFQVQQDSPDFWLDDATNWEEWTSYKEVPFDEFLKTMEMYEPSPGMGATAPIIILDYTVYATEEEAWEFQFSQIEEGSAIMPMSSTPAITIHSMTSNSVTLNLTFPVSGARGNTLGFWDFNQGEIRWIIHQNNTNRANGLVTISGLVPGGLYQFALMWSTDGGASIGGNNTIFRRVLPPHNTTETLTRSISNRGRIITYFEEQDRDQATLANFTTWINRMETVYDALERLTGHAPMSQMTIRSARTVPGGALPDGQSTWFEVAGWAGNPIGIYRPFARSFMMRLASNDWGEIIIHEMSHNFGSRRWEFCIEFFAFFKTFYVADTVPGVRFHIEEMRQWYTGRNYANLFRDHSIWGYNSRNGFNAWDCMNFAFGLATIFVDIQGRIGWEPFRQTFRYFNNLPSNRVPTNNRDRFNLFVTKLGDFSGQNVFNMISTRNRAVIEQRFGSPIGSVIPPEVIPTGVTISPAVFTRLLVDPVRYRTQQFTATVLPENATDTSVTWSIANTNIATVDTNGLVTARAAGATTLIARTSNGLAASVTVDVGLVRRAHQSRYLAMGIGWPLGSREGDGLYIRENRNFNHISSAFGPRTDAGLHMGIDIQRHSGGGAATRGTPVLAVVDGYVVHYVRRTFAPGEEGTGYSISIRSTNPRYRDPATGQQLIFVHHHLQYAPTLEMHRRVMRGQVIGYAGRTGAPRSSGHLHFEISSSGIATWGSTDRQVVIRNRINPRFFYSHDAFGGSSVTIRIWEERNWNVPTS